MSEGTKKELISSIAGATYRNKRPIYCVGMKKYCVKSVKIGILRTISFKKISLFAKNRRYLHLILKQTRLINTIKSNAYRTKLLLLNAKK